MDSAAPETVDFALLAEAREQHEAGLLRYARRFLRDAASSQDVVQETFLSLARQPEAPDLRVRLAPWLFTVCRRKALNLIRDESRHGGGGEAGENLAAPEADPATRLALAEDQARLIELVELLPEAQREVVRLRYQEDFSYQEIADITERSAGHVGVLLHKALQTLRQDWRADAAG